MLNSLNIQCRLCADPELKQTQTGVSVASVNVACDNGYGDKKESFFFSLKAFRKTAEFLCDHFHKGDLVIVSGKLSVRTYEDKNGVKRTAVECIANTLDFCGSKRTDSAGNNFAAPDVEGTTQAKFGANAANTAYDFAIIDDAADLPF